MGFGLVEYLLRRAKAHKLAQNVAAGRVVYSCSQLAVGEGPGAAFAELDVGARIERAAAAEAFHTFCALRNAAAPLEHDRTVAAPGKQQPRKHSRRAESGYHRRRDVIRGGNRTDIAYRICKPCACAVFQLFLLAAKKLEADRTQQRDFSVPRVDRFARQHGFFDITAAQSKLRRGFFDGDGGIVVRGTAYIGYNYHREGQTFR